MAIYTMLRRAVALALTAPCAMPLLAADKAQSSAAADEGPACKYCADYRGDQGWVEVGGLNLSGSSSIGFGRFGTTLGAGPFGASPDMTYGSGRYTGLTDEGATVDASGQFLHRGDGGVYYGGSASNLGLDSRDATLEGGKQGKFGISVQYDETPFREDNTTSTPYRQVGGNVFRLPLPWVDAATTQGMTLLPFTREPVDLETQRKKEGAQFSYIPAQNWEVTAGYSHETKNGRNDQGATFGFDNTVILPVPVDYQTDDYDLALNYTGQKLQARVAYHGSSFDDSNNSVFWRNPFTPSSAPQAFGEMATPPDNKLNQVTAVVGYNLLPRTRVTARLSYGQLTQDNQLLPYTTNPYIPVGGLTIGMLNGGMMPPTTRLMQRAIAPDAGDLSAQVNSTLAKLQLTSRPLPRLRLNASFTYSDRDNQTDQILRYYATTDLARSSTPRVNLPYGFTQKLGRLSAGYKLPLHSDIAVGLNYDQRDRTYQEVDQTTETTGWAKLKIRPVEMVEASVKYSHGNRDGSDYQRVWAVYPPQNWQERLYYLNGRDRDQLTGSVAITPLESVTLTGTAARTDDSYSGDHILGLRSSKTHTYTLDLSLAPIENLNMHGYYTWDRVSSLQAGSQGGLFPDWTSSNDNATHVAGVGAKWTTMQKKLELSGDVVWTNYQGSTDFTQYLLPALGYPSQSYDMVRVELKAKYKMTKKLSLRLGYRHERYNESTDYTAEGFQGLPSIIGLRQAVQQDYDVNLVSATMRYQF